MVQAVNWSHFSALKRELRVEKTAERNRVRTRTEQDSLRENVK